MRIVRATSPIRRRYSAALCAVSLALLLQCLAPPGYMAGSLEDGWPVVLCPEGLPQGFLGGHGHHHHAEASAEDVSLDGYCPLGGMLDASVSLQAPGIAPSIAAAFGIASAYQPPAPVRQFRPQTSRAPPTHV
mgnify:CR=1 FL=1